MKKRNDESAMEFLRRVISWLDCEQESLLTSLPSVEAILDYAALWTTYNTDLMSGIIECIEDGDDPKPLKDFILKYKLNWQVPTAIEA
jgi:hypothetical protein